MSPVLYFDRLQAGLRAAALAALPSATVLWAPSEFPRDATEADLVRFQLVGGPTWGRPHSEDGGSTHAAPTDVTITVTPTAGRRIYLGCTGAWWYHDVAGGETDEDVRDALAAALAAPGHQLFATITTPASDEIRLVGDDISALYGLRARGPAVAVVNASTTARAYTHDAELRVQVQVFSSSRYLSGGAVDQLQRLLGSLWTEGVQQPLDQRGVSLRSVTEPIDLTAISGARWESRAGATLRLGMRSYVAETREYIETIDIDSTLVDGATDLATSVSAAEA